MAKKKDPNDLFKKAAKKPTKPKLRLGDFTDIKAVAISVRNSVTQEHVDKLNELFNKTLGDMVKGINAHIIDATPCDYEAEDEDNEGQTKTIPGYSIPAPLGQYQLMNLCKQKLNAAPDDGSSDTVADIDYAEEPVPASNMRMEIKFSSSVVLAALKSDVMYNVLISNVLLAMMNTMQVNIGYGPKDVPYYGKYFLSFTAETEKVFTLDEANMVKVVLKSDVAKKVLEE